MAKQLTFPKGTDVSKMVIASTTRIGDLLCLSGAAGYSRELDRLRKAYLA